MQYGASAFPWHPTVNYCTETVGQYSRSTYLLLHRAVLTYYTNNITCTVTVSTKYCVIKPKYCVGIKNSVYGTIDITVYFSTQADLQKEPPPSTAVCVSQGCTQATPGIPDQHQNFHTTLIVSCIHWPLLSILAQANISYSCSLNSFARMKMYIAQHGTFPGFKLRFKFSVFQ